MNKEVVIVSTAPTPIGKAYLGTYNDTQVTTNGEVIAVGHPYGI
jgi:acetyl-CoA acetyltransferase